MAKHSKNRILHFHNFKNIFVLEKDYLDILNNYAATIEKLLKRIDLLENGFLQFSLN